jgi:hypothetical protein
MLKVNFGDGTVFQHTVLPTFGGILCPPPFSGGGEGGTWKLSIGNKKLKYCMNVYYFGCV